VVAVSAFLLSSVFKVLVEEESVDGVALAAGPDLGLDAVKGSDRGNSVREDGKRVLRRSQPLQNRVPARIPLLRTGSVAEELARRREDGRRCIG
jgi:hypothetical protein